MLLKEIIRGNRWLKASFTLTIILVAISALNLPMRKSNYLETPPTSPGPGAPACFIATAAYGSELSLEVQFLRMFRDDKVMRTFAGNSFMAVFNAWYYSFSSNIAQFIASHHQTRLVVKALLYPLIGILLLSSITFDALAHTPEFAVIVAGLVTSSLIGVVYLAPITIGGLLTLKRRGRVIHLGGLKWLASAWVMAAVSLVLGEMFILTYVMMFGTVAIVLTTILLPTAILSRKII